MDLNLKMAPRPAAGNPTLKKKIAGGAMAKHTTPKVKPVSVIAVEARYLKQTPPKPNGTKAVPNADIEFGSHSVISYSIH